VRPTKYLLPLYPCVWSASPESVPWVMGRTGGRGRALRGKEPKCKMGRTGGGGSTGYITHLCIMHGVIHPAGLILPAGLIGSGYLKIFRIKRIIGLGYFIKNNKITESLKNRSGKCKGSVGGIDG
jgi:hypothetical protein